MEGHEEGVSDHAVASARPPQSMMYRMQEVVADEHVGCTTSTAG